MKKKCLCFGGELQKQKKPRDNKKENNNDIEK